MSFSNNTIETALTHITERRKTAEQIYENKIELLKSENKKFNDICIKLKQLGTKLCMAAFSGNKQEADHIKAQLDTLNELKNEILKKNGLSNGADYKCYVCNDTGYINGKLCDCVKSEALRIRYEVLSKEMPISNCTFDNFKLTYYSDSPDESGFTPRKVIKKTVDICKSFCESFPNGENLYFCGPSGLGKTHLTLAIANEVIGKGYDVLYGSAQNIISKISKEQLNYNADSEYLDSVLDCDLLILDDLGTEFNTQLSSSVVYNIINTRLLRGLSTVISTNLSIKEIEKTYSPRIVSRLNGHYTMRMFLGEDIRALKAKG